MSGRQAKPKVKVGRAVVTREIPSPLVPLSNSFSPANTPTPRREQSFFNPLFGTPTLSPGPGTEVSSVPSGVKPGPWLVSPPPPSQTEETKSFFSSPSAWFRQNLARKTLGSSLLAFSLGSVLFFVVLGAYVVLIYLAITTKRIKYIVFLTVLAALMCLIGFNLHAGQEQPTNLTKPSRFLTEEEENAVIRRAYGKDNPV